LICELLIRSDSKSLGSITPPKVLNSDRCHRSRTDDTCKACSYREWPWLVVSQLVFTFRIVFSIFHFAFPWNGTRRAIHKKTASELFASSCFLPIYKLGIRRMKNLIWVAIVGIGLIVGAGQANAQFPSYGGGCGYGTGYGSSYGAGYGHQDHHYSIPAQPYAQNFAPTYPSYGYGGSFSSGYGSPYSMPQYTPQYSTPQVSSYYSSNNYYSQPHHPHHNWHPGHYLLGN
jgi:hypothetical protein